MASSVFDTMLSLPQPKESEEEEALVDSLDEDSGTIKILLQIISGREYPGIHLNFDALRSLSLATEKWDMPGPLSMCRMLLLNPDLVRHHAIGVYWAGCHFQWKDVSNMASGYTCYSDMFNSELESLLQAMGSTALLQLLRFHRTRQQAMSIWFETIASKIVCIQGSETLLWEAFPAFQYFKYKVLEYMENVPANSDLDYATVLELASTTQLSKARTSEARPRTPEVPHLVKEVVLKWKSLPKTL